jgi:tRNA(His) 5'-end guanylyltransferase
MKTFGEMRLGFGQSDEYSFVIPKNSGLYGESILPIL